MAKPPKEPFVSGLYKAEEDARNRPRHSIQKTVTDAEKARKVRRYYSSPMTEETRRITKRMIGERDDD